MTTIAWILALLGVFVIRQSLHGRFTHVLTDLSDAALALARNDKDALGEVLTRSGDSLTASTADVAAWNATANAEVAGATQGLGNAPPGNGVLVAAVELGTHAKGYRWAATGPDYYDCSGLMWRACQKAGVYHGPRFTTFDVERLTSFQTTRNPRVGDLVVWPTSHMGVMSGEDQMYSARSVRSGIGYSSISGHSKNPPIYLKLSSL